MDNEPLIEFQVTERVIVVLIICATLLFGTCITMKEQEAPIRPDKACVCVEMAH